MLAGHITQPGKIELVDIPEPELTGKGGDILFQPELTCLCGSDLPFFDGEMPKYPLEVGHSLHEMIGTVVDTDGKRFKPGDKVLAVPVGQQGFFERYRVTEERAIPVDPRPSRENAVLAQPLGTVLYALKKVPNLLDQDVVVVGQGPIGQIYNAVLRNMGARQIIALDRLDSRLETSPKMGATSVINVDREDPVEAVTRLTGGRMADLVVEAVGHGDQQLNLCCDLSRRLGRILFFGVPDETIDGVRWLDFLRKNVTIHLSVEPDFEESFPLAMRWMAEGRVDLSPVVTHHFALEEIQEAFDTFSQKRDGALKVFVEFPAGRGA